MRVSVLCAAAALLPLALSAQAQSEHARVDVRADVITKARGTPATGQLGAGLARRFGMFQLGILAGAGPSSEGLTARAEAVARFHIDPLREKRWGLYGAAGAGVLWAESDEAFLLLAIGAEGARGRAGWSPFLEIGSSRGVRFAAGFRRAPSRRR